MTMQSLLAKIEAIGSQQSNVDVRRSHVGIYLSPKNGDGFPISVFRAPDGDLILEFGGWHDEFECETVVLSLVKSALEGRVCLRETDLNDKPWRHEVLLLTDFGEWHLIGSMSYVRLCFFNKRTSLRVRLFGPCPITL